MNGEAEKKLVARYLAAKFSDDPNAEKILRELTEGPARDRFHVCAQVMPMYPVADEFGLACEGLSSAYDTIMEMNKVDPSLGWLAGMMGAVDSLAQDVLALVDERGLPPEKWPSLK